MKWDACHLNVSESFIFQASGSHGASHTKIIIVSFTKEPFCMSLAIYPASQGPCGALHYCPPPKETKAKHSLRRDYAKSEVTPDEVTWGMPQLCCWTQTLATVQKSQDHKMCSPTLKYMYWDWASSADDACTVESMSRCIRGT